MGYDSGNICMERVVVYLTKDEKAKLFKDAECMGLSLNKYLRKQLRLRIDYKSSGASNANK